MKYAFAGRNCTFASRQPGVVNLGDIGEVQAIALDDLLHSDVQALYICTPTETHHDLVLKAIEGGKHVLVEKTPAQTLKGFLQCRQRARLLGLKLDIFFQPVLGSDRSAKGEDYFHLPMGGVHPDPVFDVAFYPLMTFGFRGEGADRWEFYEHNDIWYCSIDNRWKLSFSINAPFAQSKQFVMPPGNRIYSDAIDRFEHLPSIAFDQPIDAYEKIMPVLLDWKKHYDDEIARA